MHSGTGRTRRKKIFTFIVEAVGAHDALVDAEDVAPGNLVGPAFERQITNSHVLRVGLVLVRSRSVTGVETNLLHT